MAINTHIGFPEKQDPKWEYVSYEYRVGSYVDINDNGEERMYVGIYRVWYKPHTKIPMIYDKEILNMNWTDAPTLFNQTKKVLDAFRQPIIPLEETFHKQTDA
jgi:hypothetical protein